MGSIRAILASVCGSVEQLDLASKYRISRGGLETLETLIESGTNQGELDLKDHRQTLFDDHEGSNCSAHVFIKESDRFLNLECVGRVLDTSIIVEPHVPSVELASKPTSDRAAIEPKYALKTPNPSECIDWPHDHNAVSMSPNELYDFGWGCHFGLRTAYHSEHQQESLAHDHNGNDTQILATQYLILAANQDHSSAQALLGIRYFTGTGVNMDEQQSIFWLTRSAMNGNDVAMDALGMMLVTSAVIRMMETGDWEMDDETATGMRWLEKSAGQGYLMADYHLGWLYHLIAKNTERNEAEGWDKMAVERLTKASSLWEAKSLLGEHMYRLGRYKDAAHWLMECMKTSAEERCMAVPQCDNIELELELSLSLSSPCSSQDGGDHDDRLTHVAENGVPPHGA